MGRFHSLAVQGGWRHRQAVLATVKVLCRLQAWLRHRVWKAIAMGQFHLPAAQDASCHHRAVMAIGKDRLLLQVVKVSPRRCHHCRAVMATGRDLLLLLVAKVLPRRCRRHHHHVRRHEPSAPCSRRRQPAPLLRPVLWSVLSAWLQSPFTFITSIRSTLGCGSPSRVRLPDSQEKRVSLSLVMVFSAAVLPPSGFTPVS